MAKRFALLSIFMTPAKISLKHRLFFCSCLTGSLPFSSRVVVIDAVVVAVVVTAAVVDVSDAAPWPLERYT